MSVTAHAYCKCYLELDDRFLQSLCPTPFVALRQAMDFRRVEPRFKCLACLFQIALLTALVLYVVYQVVIIVAFAANPPVSINWEKWKRGAGKWALCSESGQDLVEVGVGVLNETSGMSGWKLSKTKLEINEEQRNCTEVDLTHWELDKVPNKKKPSWQSGIYLFFCCQATGGWCQMYSRADKSWEYQWIIQRHIWQWLKMSMEVHRKAFGYDTESYDKLTTSYLDSWPSPSIAAGPLPDRCPVLTNFTSAEQSRGVTQVTIYDSQMMVVTELGIMPQLWDLFGKVGGYLLLLRLIFHTCFVKKYPESGVAQIYEARTFIGNRLPVIGSPSSRDGAEAQPEASQPLPRPPGMYKDLDTE